MIQIENITQLLLILLYPLEAAGFVYITKKCFIEKLSVPKGILLLLISPPAAHWAVFALSGWMILQCETISLWWYAVLSTLLLAVVQILFLFIYIRTVHAKKRSVALFVYLSCTALVPGITMAFSLPDPMLPICCTFILCAAFCLLAFRRLKEITKERQITNPRLFLTLPIVVFAYKTIILCMSVFLSGLGDEIADAHFSLYLMVKDLNTEAAELCRETVSNARDYFAAEPFIIYISDLFILIVLMGAFSVIARNIRYMTETKRAHDEVKTLAVEMMEALAHTIDAKDKYTIGHSVRVAKYSRMIAEKMGLSKKECENVYYYGLLHDLGKIGVPNEIINSPARLTDEEYNVIKCHPKIGYDILSEVHSRPDLTTGARWHHERYDGKGYPDGKCGEDIPLPARIIAVADSYDAMTSNRSYRDYLPQEKVRDELRLNMGTQFDPKIAECMLAIIAEDTEYALHE